MFYVCVGKTKKHIFFLPEYDCLPFLSVSFKFQCYDF